MSVGEWIGLIGLCVTLVGAGAGAWMTLRTKLDLVIHIQNEIKANQNEQKDEIAQLWKVHNHQEGRLYMHDRVLVAIIDKMELDIGDFEPKPKPHWKGNPDNV